MPMDWVTPIISGAAGVIGASVGVLGNAIHARTQSKLGERYRAQKMTESKFMVYNQVLDINGRIPVLEPGHGDGWRPDLYVKHVRPVLFQNLHLLDARVREQVRTIDNRLQLKRWDLMDLAEEADETDYIYYFDLIVLIEESYVSFR
ncbi:hypothetical protein JZ785_13035 [Alicyclobacillus curvatus]|jgi:hypothetical protein|nr:hypothetical protein JZ785_13035 [Alicyclobacillus curvatus]